MTRQPCRCMPGEGFAVPRCAACLAWERGLALLIDGTTVDRVTWVKAHSAPVREVEGRPDYQAYYQQEAAG